MGTVWAQVELGTSWEQIKLRTSWGQAKLGASWVQVGFKLGVRWGQVGNKMGTSWELAESKLGTSSGLVGGLGSPLAMRGFRASLIKVSVRSTRPNLFDMRRHPGRGLFGGDREREGGRGTSYVGGKLGTSWVGDKMGPK